MTVCFRDYCEKEGLVQFTEHNLYQTKMVYWLCEDHWREKFEEKPKPLKLEPVYYDYAEKRSNNSFPWMAFFEILPFIIVAIVVFCLLFWEKL